MSTSTKPRIPTIRGLEQRTYATDLHATNGLEFKVEGYASTFDSYDMGYYTETIKRGAFTKTLAGGPDVQLLVNHEGLPLARTTNGSLRLSQDDRGLHFAAQLNRADPDAVTLMSKLGSGLLSECSFAFRVVSQDWSADNTQRTITAVDLNRGDVSVCNFGANSATSVDARSRRRGKGAPRSACTRRGREHWRSAVETFTCATKRAGSDDELNRSWPGRISNSRRSGRPGQVHLPTGRTMSSRVDDLVSYYNTLDAGQQQMFRDMVELAFHRVQRQLLIERLERSVAFKISVGGVLTSPFTSSRGFEGRPNPSSSQPRRRRI